MLLNFRRLSKFMTAWTIVLTTATLSFSASAAKEIVLGNLRNRDHGIGGEVVALSDRVLEVSKIFEVHFAIAL